MADFTWHHADVTVLDNGETRKYILTSRTNGIELGHVAERDGKFLAYHRHQGFVSSWVDREDAFEAIDDAE